ncbi:MAG: MBL fold metallo-hydrolase [Burkholderiales bacterium]|nr:MBL fold metallo-hydrolase [Burkholderiales bacterium]
MPATLSFLGAAGEVTGSCFLIDTGAIRFLIDCGMFQGGREAEHKNRASFGFDARDIAFVLLSHAHIDHSGLLPRLCAQGFKGPVYATGATVDLCEVMLPDSAFIQEREAQQHALERRRARGKASYERAPLYTVAQAQACLKLMRRVEYDVEIEPHPGIRARLRHAGHILGSAIVEVRLPGKAGHRLVFSGDLGQPGHPIVQDAAEVREADTLLVESTYGNRCHKSMAETLDELTAAIKTTLEHKRGNVIIPAFAVGRTQDIVFLLAELWRSGRLPALDIYVDSPMALAATTVTMRHAQLFDEQARATLRWLSEDHPGFRVHFVQEVEDSIALNARREGAIIISASGMCDAGRIKHHLRHNLPRPECAVIIVGFQAAGSLGRRLVDRASAVRIFGEPVPVRSDIYTIGGLSAHADQAALLGWLQAFRRGPKQVYLVHGEIAAAEALRREIAERLGWQPRIARKDDGIRLA